MQVGKDLLVGGQVARPCGATALVLDSPLLPVAPWLHCRRVGSPDHYTGFLPAASLQLQGVVAFAFFGGAADSGIAPPRQSLSSVRGPQQQQQQPSRHEDRVSVQGVWIAKRLRRRTSQACPRLPRARGSSETVELLRVFLALP